MDSFRNHKKNKKSQIYFIPPSIKFAKSAFLSTLDEYILRYKILQFPFIIKYRFLVIRQEHYGKRIQYRRDSSAYRKKS